MRRAFSILFRIRALFTAASMLCACGPTTSNSVLPSFRHPLLQQRTGSSNPSPVDTQTSDSATTARRLTPRSFAHPLLNRRADFDRGPRLTVDRIDNRLAIARQARTMLSSKSASYRVGTTTYRRDCSGFVMAVLAAQGLAIESALDPGDGGGVAAIYRWAADRGAVHRRKVPAIGDLVFFDNTYDRNRDGRLNDPLTHIGIVERVDPDGTVSVIHHARRGILRYKLNRFQPRMRRDPESRKVLNHYLRVVPRGSKRRERRLTGELFHSFATIIR